MNEYMDIILDRFCDDVNCTGEVYSATKQHLNKTWWEVEEKKQFSCTLSLIQVLKLFITKTLHWIL